MPDAIFKLRVMEFRDFMAGCGECPYKIDPPANAKAKVKIQNGHKHPSFACGPNVTLHVGHYQKKYTYVAKPRIPTTVRLETHHGVLQFDIADAAGQPGPYYPIGMAFSRADGTDPIGTPYTTSGNLLTNPPFQSPFSKLKLNDPIRSIEVDVQRIQKLYSKVKGSAKASHRTYRFIVFIQDSQSGKIGVIDPEIEPPS